MNLTEIIKDAASFMKDVTVALDRGIGTVAITTPGRDDIFMQGDDATKFIEQVDLLYNESGNVTEDEAALCVAKPYAENIWS